MMKKYFFIFVSCIMFLFNGQNASATEQPKETPNIIVLKGSDETKDGLPVYEIADDDKLFMEIYDKSFVKKSIGLYRQALSYSNLENKDIYFAFKKNSGCYGRIGFSIAKRIVNLHEGEIWAEFEWNKVFFYVLIK